MPLALTSKFFTCEPSGKIHGSSLQMLKTLELLNKIQFVFAFYVPASVWQ